MAWAEQIVDVLHHFFCYPRDGISMWWRPEGPMLRLVPIAIVFLPQSFFQRAPFTVSSCLSAGGNQAAIRDCKLTKRPLSPMQELSSFIRVKRVLCLQRQGSPSGQCTANSNPIQEYRIVLLFLSLSRQPRHSALGLAIGSARESYYCHFFLHRRIGFGLTKRRKPASIAFDINLSNR